MQNTDQLIKSLSDQVMRGVVNTLSVEYVKSHEHQIDAMVEIMRSEVKALMFAPEYENERQCIMMKSMSPFYVTALIVLNCVSKIMKLG